MLRTLSAHPEEVGGVGRPRVSVEPCWLPVEALIDAQAAAIETHGGLPGLRDRGLLESALARPRQLFHYGNEPPSVDELAAAYGWGLCRNHAFGDGNKRIALIAMFVFLDLNGHDLDAREDDAYETIVAIAKGELSQPELARWIEDRAVPRT